MARVGGRMEAVAPKRSLFGPDYLLLAALLAVSVGLHVWIVTHTKITSRDSMQFGRYALRIQSPESSNPDQPRDLRKTKIDVIQEEQQPPGYPLAVWVTAKFVRRTIEPAMENGEYSGYQLAETTLLATQIASAIAGVLLVIPCYLAGRMLFGRSAGFAGALLFQVLPQPAHITSDGLTEGLYLLGTITAIMLGIRAMRKPGVGIFLLIGLTIGASNLVRYEALMLAGAIGLVVSVLVYQRKWPLDLALGRLTALGVGTMLLAGPYMILIGGISNKPTAKDLVPSVSPREEMMKGEAERAGVPLFAKWSTTEGSGYPAKLAWSGYAVADETFKSMQYLAGVFAVVGIFLVRKRIAEDPGLAFILAVAAVNAAVLVVLGVKRNYISERHTLLITFIGCLFAASALETIAAMLGRLPGVGGFWAGKFGVPALLVILVGIALPVTLRPLHAHREGFKYAGQWLAEHVEKNDAVIDPFCWADWYAGRTLYYVKPDPADHQVVYVVVDDRVRPETDDHARLERMRDVRNVLADGRRELVFCWPEGSNEETAKVKIYKLVRK